MKQFSKGDPRQFTPEPYVPLWQAILGVEGDARTLALRGEAGDAYEPEGADAFTFELSDDIEEFLEKEWLVDSWCGVNETIQVLGEPGSGKSCIVASLAVHIAAGRDWFGMKTTPGGVVYFCGERLDLTRRRIRGLQRYHDIPKGQPLAIASGPLDLAKPESVRGFIERINQFEDQTNETPALVIIDTYSRVYVGSEENDASAMSAAYAHVDQIRKESGAAVLLVHHSGVNETAKRRGRGSSVQTGAIDTSIVVTKASGGGGSAEIVKANDGPEGLTIAWDLASFTIATNAETGRVTTVPIPVPLIGLQGVRSTSKPPAVKALAPTQNAALACLRRAIETRGITSDGTPGFPADAPTISRDDWRLDFYAVDAAKSPDATPATRRKRFNRGLEDLEKAGRIGVLGDRVWVVG